MRSFKSYCALIYRKYDDQQAKALKAAAKARTTKARKKRDRKPE